MGWEDQGRQEHGWFGSGTGTKNDKEGASSDGGTFASVGIAQRIQAVAYGSIGALPHDLRTRASAQYPAGNLARLTEAMTAWIDGGRLSNAEFADRFFLRPEDDRIARTLRGAARDVRSAKSHADLAAAAEKVASAIQAVGLDHWPRFLAAAQDRARDPYTVAAVEKSRWSPEPGNGMARPVYPVETVAEIIATVMTGGGAAALRTAGGVILRQIVRSGATPTVETPEGLLQSGGKPIGQPGSSQKIRELPGGAAAAEKLFGRLSKGGTDVTPSGHPGKLVKMPDGSYFGYRPTSKSGPPSIDISVPGIDIRKLKFPGS